MSDKGFINRASQIAHSWLAAQYHTLELARRCVAENVPGSLVECGVFAGTHPAIMEYATRGDRRPIHLFDSFCGIPAPGPRDADAAKDIEGKSACSRETVEGHLANLDCDPRRFIFHEGWFCDTIPGCDIGPIALLRLDADLYESTRICLVELYPMLSPRGFCIIDDYALAGCRAAVDEYRQANGITAEIVHVADAHDVVWWQK